MKLKFVVILLISAFRLHSQQFAGPPKTACGNGVELGIPNPNPLHCYYWSGSSISGANTPNPTVYPTTSETFSVTVTDQNFSFKAIDHVYVEVVLGSMVMVPKYIKPDDSENQAVVSLIENPSSVPVIWDIPERTGAVGCVIDQNGNISNCSTNGRITVSATNANDFNCFIKEEFEVNSGVKEIRIKEMPENDRNASSLKEDPFNTLKVTKINLIEIEAFPNDEEEFPEGQPEWMGSITPTNPHQRRWFLAEDNIHVGTFYNIQAGDQEAHIDYVDSMDVSTYNGPEEFNISFILDQFQSKINGLGPFLDESPCTGNPLFTIDNLHFSVFRKWVEVNKDPRKGKYFSLEDRTDVYGPFFELEFQGGTNCTFLSRFGRSYTWPDIGGHAFLAPLLILGNSSQELTFDCNVIYDPSNPNFTTDGNSSGYTETMLSIDGSLRYEARFGMVPSLTDGPFILETGDPAEPSFFNLSAEVDLTDPPTINFEYSWGGLQIMPSGRLYVGSPSNPVWSKKPKGTLNLMDGIQAIYYHPLLPEGIFNFD